MSKKTRTKTNKAGKLMKCDGQMLKKVIEAKGYKCHELSKMLRYCSDYLTTCCRTNKISDVAAKYLMDYKIFPQMYDLEGEIKVDDIVSPTEVKIDKDDSLKKISEKTIDGASIYRGQRPQGTPRDVVISRADMQAANADVQEVKKVLNEKYGKLEKGVKGIDYGYGPAPKNTGYCSYYAAGHDIAKGVFKLMEVAMDDLKNDPEFKEMIKQAVKEAYEEL